MTTFKKTLLASSWATMSAMSLMATPQISEQGLSIEQGADRRVTVRYNLAAGENAIVTVDFETNVTGTAEGPWASIGAKNFRSVAGDVNREVAPGDHVITWRPRRDWPDHEIDGNNFRARVKAWAKSCPPDYMVFDLTVNPCSRFFYSCEDALPHGIESDLYRTEFLVMRKIPAAGVKWRMGSPASEVGRVTDGSENLHYVTLSKDYYMAVFMLTRMQYALITGASAPADNLRCQAVGELSWNKWRYNGATTAPSGNVYPVDKAVVDGSPIGALRTKTGISTMDLPTSAQWEFACRAGTATAFYNGYNPTQTGEKGKFVSDPNLNEIAWYDYNTKQEYATTTYPVGRLPFRVGTLKPNAWGLYDMLGMCYQWSLDFWRNSYDAEETDPVGPNTSSSSGKRIAKGGAWNCWIRYCRAACGYGFAPNAAYTTVGDGELFGARMTCEITIP